MSNPTSNFGWVMPTATDLVTDLPADFAVFGQAVDTSMADLKGGTTGQILSKATATDMDFTWITNDVGDITAVTAGTGITGGGTSGAVTITNDMATTITAAGDIVVGTGSGTYDNLPIGTTAQVLTADTTVSPYKVKWATPATPTSGLTLIKRASTSGAVNTGTTFDGVFTSTYKTYLINIEGWSAATGSDVPRIQLRVGGSTTATNYYGVAQNIDRSGSIAYNSTVNQTSLQMGAAGTLDAAGPAQYAIYANRVGNSSQKASLYFTGVGAGNQCFINGTLFNDGSQIYDGFILSAASNITVTLAVYGLAV